MRKFNFFILLSLLSYADYSNNKGKKGDFSFKKCSNYKISNN